MAVIPTGESETDRVRAEVKRLRQGLWDCGVIAGMDTDGCTNPDHVADVAALVHTEVQELRDAADEDPGLLYAENARLRADNERLRSWLQEVRLGVAIGAAETRGWIDQALAGLPAPEPERGTE